MRKITDNLYVGNGTDCASVPEDWGVVHACKYPCYVDAMGGTVDKTHPNWLYKWEQDHLYLNMVDPQVPLFMPETFRIFLEFMDDMWDRNIPTLIHCNMGMSRSPSLALVFLAKRTGLIHNSLYSEALEEYRKIDPDYFPGNGIRVWLTTNWNKL